MNLKLRIILSSGVVFLFGASWGLTVEYYEAPMLREKVAKGKLPPIEKRLPENPQVIEPVEEIGQYGGTWRLPYSDPGMGNLKMILYDPPVRWNRDYTAYIPGLAEKYEFSADGKILTFYFRKGTKWSDGHRFTTEDLRFWWEDLVTNEEYRVIMVPWWGYNEDRTVMQVKFVDDYTISFIFKEPHWDVPYLLASGFWGWEPLMKPKHYLQQFHPRYNPKMKDYTTLQHKDMWWQNPDYPTLFAWHLKEYKPAERATLERNPYYWKVDRAGNQLPYIDYIEAVYIPDAEVRLLQAIRGEYSATFRGIDDPRQIPVLKEKEKDGGYRVILWQRGAGAWPGLTVNQNYNTEKTKDIWMRALLRNRDFRRALSLAIDRRRVNNVVWQGMGRIQQGTISKQSWHFQSSKGKRIWQEWANNFVSYDPPEANKLLDRIGLTQRDKEGFRTRPDGKKLEIILDITSFGMASINAETAAILKKNWEAVGLRTILNAVYGTPVENIRKKQGTFQIRTSGACEMDIWTFPDWIFPTGSEGRSWPRVQQWYFTGGTQGEPPEPDSPEARLIKLYEKGMREKEPAKRHHFVWEAIQIHIDEGPFFIGITGGLQIPVIVKNNFCNVPNFGVLGPWAVGAPGNTNPEQYFIKK